MTCAWHKGGVPGYARGKPFFVPGCKVCAEKAKVNPALLDAPTPRSLSREYTRAAHGVLYQSTRYASKRWAEGLT